MFLPLNEPDLGYLLVLKIFVCSFSILFYFVFICVYFSLVPFFHFFIVLVIHICVYVCVGFMVKYIPTIGHS